jgi:transposase
MHTAGTHNIVELAEMFNVSRPTVYRELKKAKES